MAAHDPTSPEGDPFYPPAVPTLVQCMHCGEVYDSYLIQWLIEPGLDGRPSGMWRCPTENCDGAGFGFDIFPLDSDFADERGACGWSDDEEDDVCDCDCDADCDCDCCETCDCGGEGCETCETDWLQVDGEDCIFSVEQDLPTLEQDDDVLEAPNDEPEDADRPPSPAKHHKRRGRQRIDDDDDAIPF